MRPIVVGIDGTSGSELALGWALEEAKLRSAPVRVVRVFDQFPDSSGFRDHLDAAVSYVRRQLGEESVAESLSVGRPAEVIVEQAGSAQLVVVGARSRSTAGAALLGSVTSAVAAHASCPVIAARPGHPLARPPLNVVVGVDGSETSDRAVAFAFEEAAGRQLPLRVVHCWRHVDQSDPALWDERDLAAQREQRRVWVAESIAGYRTKFPDVKVTQTVVEGRPQDVLVDESEHAHLVVVGSRGLGGIAGLLLGSVSQSLLHHAHCSVAIVRP